MIEKVFKIIKTASQIFWKELVFSVEITVEAIKNKFQGLMEWFSNTWLGKKLSSIFNVDLDLKGVNKYLDQVQSNLNNVDKSASNTIDKYHDNKNGLSPWGGILGKAEFGASVGTTPNASQAISQVVNAPITIINPDPVKAGEEAKKHLDNTTSRAIRNGQTQVSH